MHLAISALLSILLTLLGGNHTTGTTSAQVETQETVSITPSVSPTDTPSVTPSIGPTDTPGVTPSVSPTDTPSVTPSVSPTTTPGVTPSVSPSVTPNPEDKDDDGDTDNRGLHIGFFNGFPFGFFVSQWAKSKGVHEGIKTSIKGKD